MGNQPGRLEVVATPIGNMDDLSDRARAALASADLVAAEDTRRTLGLLQHLGLAKPLLSLHSHNESQRLPEVLARLTGGARVVLVSDAGTPLLSDPGFELVRAAVAQGIPVGVVPGPSAITAALALAGLPVDRFCFEGFLPASARERRSRLSALATEARTMVFFEAPHRIAAALVDLSTQFGAQRPAVIARELTKLHETVYRGTLAELCAVADRDPNLQRGEITLVVQGAAPVTDGADLSLMRRALELLLRELPPGKAAAIAAQLAGGRRSDAYELAMQLSRDR
ncbi:MAG TPA: 16S rRNA (cytidine(1402)-2'-O)-methyltransferase [Steroidobacteraceae bacterium]|nr:16S rRNA (cytidine(1402)-2'-O)-methyltransferase [Steroidobacteraceae bacterium]